MELIASALPPPSILFIPLLPRRSSPLVPSIRPTPPTLANALASSSLVSIFIRCHKNKLLTRPTIGLNILSLAPPHRRPPRIPPLSLPVQVLRPVPSFSISHVAPAIQMRGRTPDCRTPHPWEQHWTTRYISTFQRSTFNLNQFIRCSLSALSRPLWRLDINHPTMACHSSTLTSSFCTMSHPHPYQPTTTEMNRSSQLPLPQL